MTRRPFQDEEPPLPPKKPQWPKPMGKTHILLAKSGSTVIAILMWASIKHTLRDTHNENISNMQLQASESGNPLVIDTTTNTISSQIVDAITGKVESQSTVIINPAGQEPAIQVITPDATITASKTGEVETIIPKEDTKEKPLTETEAKQTVDIALKDAIEKTLPKEEPIKPTIPLEEKK